MTNDEKITNELEEAFREMHMARPPYVLERLVVGSKFTPEQQYAQCVLELSIAYDNLRLAEIDCQIKEHEMKDLDGKGVVEDLEKQKKAIELEQTNRAMIGKKREFDCLYAMWKSFPKKYTREEINAAQPEEYRQRLLTQAEQDMHAMGRISAGNQEGLRQIGQVPYPQLDFARDVERRYLEEGKFRVLLVVPTKDKDEKLKCVKGLNFPAGAEIKILNSYGRPVADNYNDAVKMALEDKADFVVTVEDDTFPPADAFVRLFELIRQHKKSAVGAWYPKKEEARQGVHIVQGKDGRTFMEDDGTVQEAYTMAMGCSIYPIEMFMQVPFPWFVTTDQLSQDSYFSQLAREKGWKLLVDTSVKCGHRDRATGRTFT